MPDPVTPKILAINNVDFSSYVNQKSYKVQQAREYTTWVDGNRITRRTITRTKIAGSFTMTFRTPTAYSAFRTAVAAATTDDDYTAVTLHVDNLDSVQTINAFLTLSTKTARNQQTNDSAVFEVTVTIEQR